MPYIRCGISTVHTKLFMTETLRDHSSPPSVWIPMRKIASSFLFLPDGREERKFKTSMYGGGERENHCKMLKTRGASTYLY